MDLASGPWQLDRPNWLSSTRLSDLEQTMKYAPPILLALTSFVSMPASAAGVPAYAALHIGTTPGLIVMMRFPSMPACRRELPGLKTLLAGELRRSGFKRPDLVLPDAVPGHIVTLPLIDGLCRTLAKVVPR